MSALLIGWRVPAGPITTRWRGPAGVLEAIARSPETPLTAFIVASGGAAAAAPYVHTQASASAEWVINHNLGWRPQVEVLSAGGAEVVAEVVHFSVNQCRIYFNQARTGSAVVR